MNLSGQVLLPDGLLAWLRDFRLPFYEVRGHSSLREQCVDEAISSEEDRSDEHVFHLGLAFKAELLEHLLGLQVHNVRTGILARYHKHRVVTHQVD